MGWVSRLGTVFMFYDSIEEIPLGGLFVLSFLHLFVYYFIISAHGKTNHNQ